MRRLDKEHGAVAVEFAILLPVLLLLVLGVAEFGRGFNAQITLTQAAREGVRVMAITDDLGASETAAISAAVSLNPAITTADIDVVADCASPSEQVTLTINYSLDSMTGIAGPFDLTGIGVMKCGG